MLSPSQSLQYLKGSIERASMSTEWILSRFSAYRRLPVKGMPSKSMLHMCHERCNSDPHPTPEIRSRG
ncbi:protein NinF [Escherichia coli]|uniref:protein NinF n=1 Tax=Escherichia coli TaxID=562 RepID=UPI00158929BA|nr:protein NinF [Escherichia coli]